MVERLIVSDNVVERKYGVSLIQKLHLLRYARVDFNMHCSWFLAVSVMLYCLQNSLFLITEIWSQMLLKIFQYCFYDTLFCKEWSRDISSLWSTKNHPFNLEYFLSWVGAILVDLRSSQGECYFCWGLKEEDKSYFAYSYCSC